MASGIFVGGTVSGIGGSGGIGGSPAIMKAQYSDARNQIQPAPPVSPMARHAEVLHKLAEELQQLNNRLANTIAQIIGPCPESATQGGEQPAPQGTLMVAQFGAERINLGVNRLAELITRLEGIV